MIPLSLVTGFLGSGKTTLLQRIVDRHRDRRLVYIVNECGEIDLDGRLLELPDDRLVCIPGGSIFCRCLSGEFLRILQDLPRHFDDADAPLEGVVIEASGIADPKIITQMLRETRLDQVYERRSIIDVIDPGSFLKLLRTLPSIVSQVEACDLAIINKVDLHQEGNLKEVEREVERINPAARVTRARYCRVDFDLFAAAPSRELEGRYALCRDPNFVTQTLSVSAPVKADLFLAELHTIREHVYRIKGFVPIADGVMYVDVAAGQVNNRRVPYPGEAHQPIRPGEPGHLVFITHPDTRARADGIIAKLNTDLLLC